jgi:hypothetical protein
VPESEDLFAEVAALRAQVNDVSASTQALLRLSGKELKSELLDYLRSDEVAHAIFDLCDGERSQSDIVAVLEPKAIRGGSAMGISRRIETMVHDKNLLIQAGRKGKSPIYKHTHAAITLQIARGLGR